MTKQELAFDLRILRDIQFSETRHTCTSKSHWKKKIGELNTWKDARLNIEEM